MITLHWPWALLALPLPLLVYLALPATQPAPGAALKTPFLGELGEPATLDTNVVRTFWRRWRLWLAVVAWCLAVLAAARPQWLGEPAALPTSGRDLMLAVDISGSMKETDFRLRGQTVSRIVATKWVANDFIGRRNGDRIGLILFGDQAYLQAPLTFDRNTVQTLLGEAAIGLAGKKTAIGDAIGLAVKRMQEGKETSQVLVLLTDGANTAGAMEPVQAAQLAAETGLRIHTIGIGADEMLVRGLFGSRRVNPSAELDEKTLQAIAEATGGRYFRARDTGELQQIYALLDELEPVEQDSDYFRPQKALYPWPLGAAVTLAGLLAMAGRNGAAT